MKCIKCLEKKNQTVASPSQCRPRKCLRCEHDAIGFHTEQRIFDQTCVSAPAENTFHLRQLLRRIWRNKASRVKYSRLKSGTNENTIIPQRIHQRFQFVHRLDQLKPEFVRTVNLCETNKTEIVSDKYNAWIAIRNRLTSEMSILMVDPTSKLSYCSMRTCLNGSVVVINSSRIVKNSN